MVKEKGVTVKNNRPNSSYCGNVLRCIKPSLNSTHFAVREQSVCNALDCSTTVVSIITL